MCCCSGSGNPPPPPPGTGSIPPGCITAPCPQPVTVVINLSQPVGCPGHPLLITAIGSPSGGTYAWTRTGTGTELVDAAGSPISAGDTVYLRGFSKDDSDGKILEQSASLTVTYTHANGTATDTKPAKIHKIDFEVTDTGITAGVIQANETAGAVSLALAPGVATMATDPKVKIKLDPSCPRKTDCAKNHRVGWLQAVTSHVRSIRFTHSLGTVTMPIPIRDNISGPFPFYEWVSDFTGDNDTETAHHEDSPSTNSPWIDWRVAAPAPPPALNRQLRSVTFNEGFTAWLVVQNIEWKDHDLAGSFAYQKHFDWSLALAVAVDTTQAVGSRCTPASSVPTIAAMSNGKGSDPELTLPTANGSMTVTIVAVPGI